MADLAKRSLSERPLSQEEECCDWYYPEILSRIKPQLNDNVIDLQKVIGTRVLLIEDDRTTRRMVSKSIGDYCDLIYAPNAGNGISKYLNFDPDIVFLDLNLPDNNGHEILKWIMRNDPGAYVVIFSGNCDADNIEAAMDNGARGYVSKPFHSALMMSYISQCPTLHAA